MGFNLNEYETVADRIERFWNDHADGRIITELVSHDEKRFVVKAAVWRSSLSGPDTTGYAEEIVGSTNVNKTSALENCETSAIGRALANLGYAPKGQRPSREEMVKVASRGETERIIDEARNQTDRAQLPRLRVESVRQPGQEPGTCRPGQEADAGVQMFQPRLYRRAGGRAVLRTGVARDRRLRLVPGHPTWHAGRRRRHPSTRPPARGSSRHVALAPLVVKEPRGSRF